jgi:nucleotide-binding universal stress UspA family protein
MKNILIPYDGSEQGTRVVAKGKIIALALNANVILLNVINETFPIYTFGHAVASIGDISQLYVEFRKKSEELLKEARDSFGEFKDNVQVVSIEGDAASKIIDYISGNQIDLVIMGYHGGGSTINKFLMGSVTTKVLHHVSIPVMVVK